MKITIKDFTKTTGFDTVSIDVFEFEGTEVEFDTVCEKLGV